MIHPRQTIRNRVVALLIAAATAAGSDVRSSRTLPTGKRTTTLNVLTGSDGRYEGNDGGAELDMSTYRIDRSVDLVIEATHSSPLGSDDELDALCREVEVAIKGDPTLTGAVLFHQYEGTDLEPTSGVDPPGQIARIQYTMVYQEDWS